MIKVIKRNGNLESFDLSRIEKAMTKAFNSCGIEPK